MELKTNKNNAFMFITNRGMKFALATMLVNLQEVIPSFDYTVVVLHDGLTSDDINDLNKIYDSIDFIEYTLEDWQNDHKFLDSDKAKDFVSRYTHLAYSKYKIFELNKKYKKILFLDLDMLVRGDVTALFDLRGAASRNGLDFHSRISIDVSLDDYPEIKKQVPVGYPKLNGGLIYVNLTNEEADACIESAKSFVMTFMDKIASVCDELAIAYATCVNNIYLTQLDKKKYNTLPRICVDSTKVIHFMGKRKPWNDSLMQIAFTEWFEYYDKAMQIADFSSESVKRDSKKGETISKIMIREQWLEFFRQADFVVPAGLQLELNFDYPKMLMKYSDDITYGLTFNQDNEDILYFSNVWITNEKLIKSAELEKALYAAKFKGTKKVYVTKKDKELHVRIPRKKAENINEIFTSFYEVTLDLIKKYSE